MAGFLYFFPDLEMAGALTWQMLPRTDPKDPKSPFLLPHLEGASIETRSPCAGPQGTRGLMVSPEVAPGSGGQKAPCLFEADKQEWREVKVSGKTTHWLGWLKEAPPGPVDLQRPRMFAGHSVRLGDGNEWTVPVVGPTVNRTSLTKEFDFDGDGELGMRIAARHAGIFRRSVQFFEFVYAGGQVSWADVFGYCCDVLALNYRLGKAECAAWGLNLFSSENFEDVVGASVGKPDIDAEYTAQKKMAVTPDDGT